MTKIFLWTPGLIFDERHVEMCRVQSLLKRRIQRHRPELDIVSGLLVDWSKPEQEARIDELASEFDVYARNTPPEFGTTWGIRKPTHWAIHLAEQMGATHILRVIQDTFVDDPLGFAEHIVRSVDEPGHWIGAYVHHWPVTQHAGWCHQMGIACETDLHYANGQVMLAPLETWQKYYLPLPTGITHYLDDVLMSEWVRQTDGRLIDWHPCWTHAHHCEAAHAAGVYLQHLGERETDGRHPTIHVITPFARTHLLPQFLPMLESQGVIWHPIHHEPMGVAADWIQPMAVEPAWGEQNPCYWKLNQWIERLHGSIQDDNAYCFCGDDDAYPARFFDAVRETRFGDVLFVSMQTPEQRLVAARENIKRNNVGLQQFFVTGRILKTMRFLNVANADGTMAEWLVSQWHCAYRPDLVVQYNKLSIDQIRLKSAWSES